MKIKVFPVWFYLQDIHFNEVWESHLLCKHIIFIKFVSLQKELSLIDKKIKDANYSKFSLKLQVNPSL